MKTKLTAILLATLLSLSMAYAGGDSAPIVDRSNCVKVTSTDGTVTWICDESRG